MVQAKIRVEFGRRVSNEDEFSTDDSHTGWTKNITNIFTLTVLTAVNMPRNVILNLFTVRAL